MNRRKFIELARSLVALPIAARAQQSTLPTVGFLRSTSPARFAHIVAAFRQGLRETGFVEGQNVAIEFRWADNQLARLPSLAEELIRRPVNVIVGNSVAAEAAKTLTTTIPIVFVTSDDPVARGLVGNLSRPDGNLTGITFFGGGELGSKRLELLRELVPRAAVIGFLMDKNYSGSESELQDVQEAARAIGRKIVVASIVTEHDLEPAFVTFKSAGAEALVVSGSPFFSSRSRPIVALAASYRLPAIYDLREHVAEGGLISYSASFSDAYRQAGAYAGRILRGAKVAELPVLQPTKFELAINLKTAKALNLVVPSALLYRADEVIQ
jgi:putative ABC transport system substrate-binding protein